MLTCSTAHVSQSSDNVSLTAPLVLQAFLNTQGVKDVLNKTSSPLAAITVLKKICVHPNLLSERAANAVAKGGEGLSCHSRALSRDPSMLLLCRTFNC